MTATPATNHSLSPSSSTNYLICRSFIVIVLLSLLNNVWGGPSFRPSSAYHDNPGLVFYDLEDKCNMEESVQILCQTCAKVTKSEIVYPMCCTNKEDARVWCDRYTSFGIQ